MSFIFNLEIYLKDINLFGGVYFSHYFEWQGMAREAFLKSNIPSVGEILEKNMRLVTLEALIVYSESLSFHDEIQIRVNTHNINKAYLELIFLYFKNKKNVAAIGKQKVCFSNPLGNPILIPEEVCAKAFKFLWVNDKEAQSFICGAFQEKLKRKKFFDL